MTTTRLGKMLLAGATIALMSSASSAHADTEQPEGSAPTPAPAAAAAPAAPAPSATTEPPPAAEGHRTAWPWVIMGGGVALIVTAAVLEVHAVKEDDRREADETKLFSTPPGDPDRVALQKSASSHDDSAKSTRTAALVIGTVGFLAVAGSVILWFVEGSSGSGDDTTKKTTKPKLLPSFGPGYAGASLGASF